MIPFYRYLEVALYSLLNFVPFMILALYPFRRHLRFSNVVVGILIGLICLVRIALGYLATFSNLSSSILTAMSTVIYASFFLTVTKDRIGKLIFVILVLSNIGNLAAVFSKYLEGLLFPSMVHQEYRWSLCLCMVIVEAVITVPLGFYVKKYYTSNLPVQTSSWAYLWIIPGTFYLIWHYHLYFTGHSSLEVSLDSHNLIFLLFSNVGAFVVYHTVILLLQAVKKAQLLKEQNHLLSMREMQYENLQERINEARQAKHDVRHHTHLIREYLRDGKLQELDAYLESYESSLPDTQSMIYCQHYATNALLGYFYHKAKKHNIEMDVFVQLPETIELPETTLSVVLGNLLENAIEACKTVTAAMRRITVRGKKNANCIFFEISNPYEGDLRQTRSGAFLSTKAADRGLGLESVGELAKAHNGMLEVDAKNGIFRASILLTEKMN